MPMSFILYERLRHIVASVAIASVIGVVIATRLIHGQTCTANAIVCENQQGGSPASVWDISGAGDATLQGFATAASVNKGETVHFKVATSAASYQVDIYRLGYYGGAGARLVAALGVVAGQNQPTCLTAAGTGL